MEPILRFYFPPWNGTGQGPDGRSADGDNNLSAEKPPQKTYSSLWTDGLAIRRGGRARSVKIIRQGKVLQPTPLMRRSQWRCGGNALPEIPDKKASKSRCLG